MALGSAFRTRPSGEVGGISADYPSLIGRGEAQPIGPNNLNAIIAGQAERRAREEEVKAKKDAALEKELEVAKPNILPRDEKRFEQMRGDYYNDKLENVNNLDDPEVKARLRRKKQELVAFGAQSANLHKEVLRTQYKFSDKETENAENFDELYDPTFSGVEGTPTEQYAENLRLLGEIKEVIPPFDLDKDFRLNVLRPMNAAKDKGQTSLTLDDGTVVTTKWSELTEDEAKAIAGQRLLFDPVDKAAREAFEKLTPTEQAEFEGYEDHYITSRTTPFIGKDKFQRRTKADPSRSYTYGAGRATSKKWNFVDTVQTPKEYDWEKETPFLPKEVIDALKEEQKTRKKVEGERQIHTVRIQNVGTETENKPISIQVDKEGSRVYAFPIAWRYEEGKEDEAKLVIGQKVGTGADAKWLIDEIPANISSGDIDAATEMTLELFREKAGGGTTSEPQAAEYNNITTTKNAEGKIIKIGVKDGKWYNVNTGKIYK